MPTQKSEVLLQVKGKPARAFLAHPEGGGPGVLLLHAWWGWTEVVKQAAEQLAGRGFTVLAPDLYSGRLAKTVEEAEALLKQRDLEFMSDTVHTARDLLLARTQGGRLGVVGFSMGAAWSLIAAAEAPDNFAAVVLFYGTYGVDFSQVKARILGHYSDSDAYESMDDVRAMESGMKEACLDVTLHIYAGLNHWFAEPDRPEYDRAAAETAWDRTVKFLKAALPA
jgi:carboxymethylenebutenolidase